MLFRSLLIAATLLQHASTTPIKAQDVVTYPIPSGIPLQKTFKTQVSSARKNKWQTVESFQATLNEVNITTGSSIYHTTSVASFDFSNSVDVSIVYQGNDRVEGVQIRPYSLNIQPIVRGRQISFTLSQPRNLVIQVNNDEWDCLHLFSNAIEDDIPSANDSSVLYFGPGIHNVPGGTTNVTSGQTVYIAGGAFVTSTFAFQNISSATLRGRGVVYRPKAGAIVAESSRDIVVKDLIFANPSGYTITAGEVDGMAVRNIRSFSSVSWGDGIDYFCSRNILVDGIFMRNSDDCVALYQHRWNYYGDSDNITVQNAALWPNLAHPINIGTHGNTEHPETMSNVVFKSIDVLHHRELQQLYQGALAINGGDDNLIENVTVDGLRIEDITIGQVVNLRVMYNTKYNTSPGRGIRNVLIKNMSYNGTSADTSIIEGYSEDRNISSVRFENLVVNNKPITDTMKKPSWYMTTDYVPAYVGPFVTDLTFV